jgi:hypothetical protein
MDKWPGGGAQAGLEAAGDDTCVVDGVEAGACAQMPAATATPTAETNRDRIIRNSPGENSLDKTFVTWTALKSSQSDGWLCKQVTNSPSQRSSAQHSRICIDNIPSIRRVQEIHK